MLTKKEILKTYWHFDAFRPMQEDIIDTVLAGKDCVALLPTGGGKSLCYQIPALLMEGLTLVVTPLISLMQDQVAHLKGKGISAEYLHAGLKYAEVAALLASAEKGEIKLLYVSPERLQSVAFKEALPYLNLSLIAVDEAHCISQWGHDFRAEFLQIRSVREVWKSTPVIALTASATDEVLKDILLQLNIPDAKIFRKSFNRENIFYRIRYSENKYRETVQHFLTSAGCAIVYCRSRRKTEELALLLQQNNINAAAYHAGMPRDVRKQVQENWMQDRIRVIVATTAFGMGIDKADVRSVLHFDAPEHLEAFYQETGRAGRDGEPALALCLYNSGDIQRLSDSTAVCFPATDYLRKIYQCVCDYLQIPTGAEPDDYFDFDLSAFLLNFKLEALPASHALRLLGREGLWTLSESVFRPATVQFTCDRSTLDDISSRYPMLSAVATGLLRLFSGIFHYPGTVNPFYLSRHLRMKKEDVELSLRQMHQMEVLVYTPATEGPMLHFHHYRVPSKELILDVQRIKRLRENHRKRSEYMIRFLQNKQQCFNEILLQYFGEKTTHHCSHCGFCLEKRQEATSPSDLRRQILAAVNAGLKIPLQDLLSLLETPADPALQMIRKMIDEGILDLGEGDAIQLA